MTESPLGRARLDKSLWAALIGQPELGIAVCNADGLLVALNPALETTLRAPYKRTTLEEWSSLYHLFDEHDRPLAYDNSPLLQTLRGETVVDRIVSTRPGDGSVGYLRCNGARLYNCRGTIAGALVFAADITAAVIQRDEVATLREQLIQVVNHELRTPTSVIKGHAELLRDLDETLPETATRHLEPIARAVERLDAVLHRIRELVDQSAGPSA